LDQGQLVGQGRYRVEEQLGCGGLGETWRGLDTATDQPVVLKTMRPDRLDDAQAVRGFLNEASHGGAVQHAGVARTIGLIEDDVPPPGVIVQELAPGHSLATEIAQSGPIETKRALLIVAKVARALRAVHAAGLVHRDVSAVNIIIDQAENPVLIDFGIATPIGSPSVTTHLTVPGNPDYLAPELTRGQPATPAADIYSLGIILYEALTGQKPYSRASREATATAHVISPSPVAPANLPRDVRSFMALLMNKDPARRPQNALAVARLLEAFAAALPGGN